MYVNEPVGIITVEDVLEELIGTVRTSHAFWTCTCNLVMLEMPWVL